MTNSNDYGNYINLSNRSKEQIQARLELSIYSAGINTLEHTFANTLKDDLYYGFFKVDADNGNNELPIRVTTDGVVHLEVCPEDFQIGHIDDLVTLAKNLTIFKDTDLKGGK
ncbi:MAG: hypothetical protein Tp1102DCM295711_34 [Prokaryotic dsDNA virus sp.]|nr:MAG: hypothetical protein Tp1102DCM295711_34 [Prokaryotic dsDNA virus sp.]